MYPTPNERTAEWVWSWVLARSAENVCTIMFKAGPWTSSPEIVKPMNAGTKEPAEGKGKDIMSKGSYLRQLCRFRKRCRSRCSSHSPGIQCHPKSARTCFEGPFGEVVRATGPVAKANPFRFSSKFQDDETDLLYYGHRYYDASTGRWLNRDPIEEKGGLNLYGFVDDDAINYIDALGLMRIGELRALLVALNNAVKNEKCCCAQKTSIDITIDGKASGREITMSAKLAKSGCTNTIEKIQYFWWDCFTAQREYDRDKSPIKPRGDNVFQEYGWLPGEATRTRKEKGAGEYFDYSDSHHWNWQAAVIYVYCGRDGHKHAALRWSNAVQWTWGGDGWGSPQDGHGGKF